MPRMDAFRRTPGKPDWQDAVAAVLIVTELALIGVGVSLQGRGKPAHAAPVVTQQYAGDVAHVERRSRPRGQYQVVFRCNHGRFVITGVAGTQADATFTATRAEGANGTLFWAEHGPADSHGTVIVKGLSVLP